MIAALAGMTYILPASGIATVSLGNLLNLPNAAVVALFGSLNLVGAAILGQLGGKIVEEVKGRPSFIRSHLIRDAHVMPAEPEPK